MKCPFLKEGFGLPECVSMAVNMDSYCLSEFHYEEFCIETAYKVCPYFINSLETVLAASLEAA